MDSNKLTVFHFFSSGLILMFYFKNKIFYFLLPIKRTVQERRIVYSLNKDIQTYLDKEAS